MAADLCLAMVQCWEVVGGGDKGGILVRKGHELASAQYDERLSTGALVEETKLVGERLCYTRLTGSGPREGWVSIKLPGKDLVIRTSKRPPPNKAYPAQASSAPPPKAPANSSPVRAAPEPPRAETLRVPAAAEKVKHETSNQDSDIGHATNSHQDARSVVCTADGAMDLGAVGDTESCSHFRIQPMPAIAGLPTGGFTGTLGWFEPLGHLHKVLSGALGVAPSSLSVAYRGRDLEEGATLVSMSVVGTTRVAKTRAKDLRVDFVFMLENGAKIKPELFRSS